MIRYILTIDYDNGDCECQSTTEVLPIVSELSKDEVLLFLLGELESIKQAEKEYWRLRTEWRESCPGYNARGYNGNNARVIEKRNKQDEVFSTVYNEWLAKEPKTEKPVDRFYFGGQTIHTMYVNDGSFTVQTVDEFFACVE